MKIIAHRGASGYAPENTLSSFKKAMEMNADGIELDVQLTNDNKLVVIHDFELGRTCTGSGPIRELDLDYIKKQDAGSWFDTSFKGETVPTLAEVFEVIPKGKTINIEIKSIGIDQRDIARYVVKEILENEREDDCIVSSFNHRILNDVLKISSEVRIGALISARLLYLEEYFKMLPVYSAHLAVQNTDYDILENMHKSGYKVFVWTVNDKNTAKLLKSAGIEAIITDYPDILID